MSKAGRPLKYGKPKDLEAVLNDYFEETSPDEWTVTGLALAMGGKQLLDDYGKREGYRELVSVAKLKVENAYEKSLRRHGRSGDIFALKNFGWRDAQHIEGRHTQEHSISPEALDKIEQASQNVAQILKSVRTGNTKADS